MKKRIALPILMVVLPLWWAAGRMYFGRSQPGSSPPAPTSWSAPAPSASPAALSGPVSLDAKCQASLPHGVAPAFTRAQPSLRYLCYPSFAVGYFAGTRTPLWSAEYLTPARIQAARQLHRVNAFHVEPSLPSNEAAQLSDYVHSGYDRGHLSPSGDQPDAATQLDSFSLANMAPQDPGLNRGPWEELESATRNLALREPVYVVTGVRFVGQQIDFLHNRVGVPTSFYKLIYDPERQAAVVFEAPNQSGGQPQPVSVAAFEQASGMTFGLGPVAPLTLPTASRSPYRTRSGP